MGHSEAAPADHETIQKPEVICLCVPSDVLHTLLLVHKPGKDEE